MSSGIKFHYNERIGRLGFLDSVGDDAQWIDAPEGAKAGDYISDWNMSVSSPTLTGKRGSSYRPTGTSYSYPESGSGSGGSGSSSTGGGSVQPTKPLQVGTGGSQSGSSTNTVNKVPKYSIDYGTQTVQGQLDGLLQKDNPLMQLARSRGMQHANSRGLLNSSLAADAAQTAMMDYALPIAQADAGIYNDYGITEYQAQIADSQLRLQNALEQGNMRLANQLEQQLNQQKADLDLRNNQQLTNAEMANNMAIERLKQNSGLYAQFLQGMSDINSADMDQKAKDNAMSALWDAIQQGTSMATTLSGVRFEDGKLVYEEIPQGGPAQIGKPEVPQSSTTSMTWGDGGIYTSGVTRNVRGELVDKNGDPKPQSSGFGPFGGGRYELINGEWKAVGGNTGLPG